jgi:hypothetical protein
VKHVAIALLVTAALLAGGCGPQLPYEKVDAKAYAARPGDWRKKPVQFTGTLVVVKERGPKKRADLVLDAAGVLILAEYEPGKVSQPFKVGAVVTIFGLGTGNGIELTLMKGRKSFPEIALSRIESAVSSTSVSTPDTQAASSVSSSGDVSTISPASSGAAPRVTNSAVLEEMRANYDKDVVAVKVDDNGAGIVRIDIYTTYYPDHDVVDNVSGMARTAAVLGVVAKAYQTASIDTYVWPSSKEFTLAHGSVRWTDGKLDAPVKLWLNQVLR